MPNPTPREQLLNVIAGRSAHGHSSGKPSIAFPIGSDVIEPVSVAAGLLLTAFYAQSFKPEALDRLSSVLLRKFACHVVRRGKAYAKSADILTDAATVARYLERRLHLVTGAMGYSGYLRTAQMFERDEFMIVEDHERALQILERAHARANVPVPPVVWQDGALRLHRLTTPVHVYDEGRAFDNCLGAHFAHHLNPATVAYPRDLELLTYYRRMRTQPFQILSLRRAGLRIGCFSLLWGVMQESQVAQRPCRLSDNQITTVARWATGRYCGPGALARDELLPIISGPGDGDGAPLGGSVNGSGARPVAAELRSFPPQLPMRLAGHQQQPDNGRRIAGGSSLS